VVVAEARLHDPVGARLAVQAVHAAVAVPGHGQGDGREDEGAEQHGDDGDANHRPDCGTPRI
jgi:hypothetical protein